jgi:hypothetical protein
VADAWDIIRAREEDRKVTDPARDDIQTLRNAIEDKLTASWARDPSEGLAALSRLEALRDAAEAAVHACLPLLPVRGSWNSGYRLQPTDQHTFVALPEEWNTAADAIAELHAALAACDNEPSGGTAT